MSKKIREQVSTSTEWTEKRYYVILGFLLERQEGSMSGEGTRTREKMTKP